MRNILFDTLKSPIRSELPYMMLLHNSNSYELHQENRRIFRWTMPLELFYIKKIYEEALYTADGPQSLNALDSHHNPVRNNFSHFHIPPTPRLLTIPHTDWYSYRQLLTTMIDYRIPLTTNEEMEQTTKTVIVTIWSAYELNTTNTKKTTYTPPKKLQTQLLIKIKRWARKHWQSKRHLAFKSLYSWLQKLVKNRTKKIIWTGISQYWP